eukprot:scaffold1636_cov165-Ochromonas_danica.AAC.14
MSDATFLRYLKARNFDVKKATTMLHNTISWRRDFKVHEIDQWKDIITTENATGKSYVRGFDKVGHPIIIMRPACENTFQYEGNMKHLVYTMERAVACMDSTGQEKLSLVIDYTRYSLSTAPPLKTARETLTILQDHYPERLYRAYCIYPPFIFWAFFKMVSPFIDPVTKNKIVMVTSSEMVKADNQFFREIDRKTLEAAVGGEDTRLFDSATYLNGPFNKDFNAILELKQKEGEKEATKDT